MKGNLLTVSNAKTVKGEALGYLTGILYLSPHKLSGLGNLCPHASAGCAAACLNTAGRGGMSSTQQARLRKTRMFFEHTREFVSLLAEDILALERRAKRIGLTPVVRLNGTSDVPWELMRSTASKTLMETFPHIQFYDYTKRPNRQPWWPNYHLTFSRSESNEAQCLHELKHGRNVAVVFSTKKGQPLPTVWNGHAVVDGDEHDLRFLDPRWVVVGLRAKGRARKLRDGFVVEV